MAFIKMDDIKEKIGEETYLSEGKESLVYKDGNRVIKLFKTNRLSPLKRISDEGLVKLSELSFKHFNNPVDIIFDNNIIVGYTENYLEIKDLNEEFSEKVLDEIKEDINTLSYSGFKMEDILYNYTSSDDIKFYDMTSYIYTNTTKKQLLDFYYKKNIAYINIFLVGITQFGAYKHGQSNELTKTYLVNQYINENVKDEYYGDYIKRINMEKIL